MSIKRLIITFFIIALMLMHSSACRYKEGPLLSTRLAERRLEGHYSLSRITINGLDYTEIYEDSCNCSFVFLSTRDRVYLNNCQPDSVAATILGNYSFLNHKQDLVLDFLKKGTMGDSALGFGPFNYEISSVWKILRLTNREVVIESNYLNDNFRVELKEIVY